MNRTNIEYLDFTWNPIAMRCTPISEACEHCWHLAMAKRLSNNPRIPYWERVAYNGGTPYLIDNRLDAPLKRKKPARIGVQFMGDLFHDDVTNEMIDAVFRVMAHDVCDPLYGLNSQTRHTYLILTKRPKRILTGHPEFFARWPNIWLGITAENQKRADERIPILLQIPAAKRFVSIEPMLGPVDFRPWINKGILENNGAYIGPKKPRIDWVICGGETGPGARPMYPEWVRSIRDQCQEAGVPFFFKKWGTCPYPPNTEISDWVEVGYDPYDKSGGGHLLDGQEWRESPKCTKFEEEAP